jgi:hypothetical protein
MQERGHMLTVLYIMNDIFSLLCVVTLMI